jgi:pimeloyl-ACP methyl ester carboxylesterase
VAIRTPKWSRRSLLTEAAPAIAGGLAAFGLAARAIGGPARSARDGASPENRKMWSGEYWAKKGEVSLYIYRKRLGAPQPGEALPVLFLAHGSSVSSRPTFDLQVPGHGEYSVMDKFAEYGFDVWTMDFEGYGKSTRTQGNSDIASGAEDLQAASEVVVRETGQKSFHIYGESSGALRAGVFAMARPEHIRRLVLVSFTWTGQGSPTLAKRAESLDFYRTHNRRRRDRDMIRSIFTRDKPGTSDPAVAEALADAELPFGDTIPTGTYLDMTANLPLVDPLKLHVPVLIARGEYDGIATEEDLLNFFRKLPNPDRQFVMIPGATHAVGLGTNRQLLWHATRAFLDMPVRHDLSDKVNLAS